MSGGKLPSTRLSLTFLFDLPAIVKEPSTEAHDAACKKVAKETGLVPEDAVSAKAAACTDMTLPAVHNADFDPTHHVGTGGPAIRLEFFYDPDWPKMAVRVVTSLGEDKEMIIDGVLASRVVFHTIEVLEGKPLAMHSPANRKAQGMIPPFNYGMRQRLNFLYEIPGTLIRMLLAHVSLFLDKLLGRSAPADPTVVTDAKSLIRFVQSERANDPAVSQLFCVPPSTSEKPFRLFLALVETWRSTLSLAAYFFLLNFSPLVAPAVSADVNDIISPERRYMCAFEKPGPTPPPPLWSVANFQVCSVFAGSASCSTLLTTSTCLVLRRRWPASSSSTTMAFTHTISLQGPLRLCGTGSSWVRICTAPGAYRLTAFSCAGCAGCRRRSAGAISLPSSGSPSLRSPRTCTGSRQWDFPPASHPRANEAA